MPRYDGTGPQGQGPLTGRGEGYCAVRLPEDGQDAYGVAGWNATPVRPPVTRRPLGRLWSWLGGGIRRPLGRGYGRGGGRGSGRGYGRGRGRRSGRW